MNWQAARNRTDRGNGRRDWPHVAVFASSSCYARYRSALLDETMLRIIETAGDVLDWDGGDPEFLTYVKDAWPVLADEYEWEREGGDDPWNRVRVADRFELPWRGPATRSELVALEHEDLRYKDCGEADSAVTFRR